MVAKVARRGRPAVYVGAVKSKIVSLIRKNGLTGARKILAKDGILVKVEKKGEKVEVMKKMKISMPTLGKFAVEAGIELHAGRPVKQKEKKVRVKKAAPVVAPVEVPQEEVAA